MTTSRKSALISTVATLLALVVITLPSTASAFNAAGDFSVSSNPNGTWSYGWSTTLGSAFTLNTSNTAAAYGLTGLGGWFAGVSPEGVPSVLRNNTASPITLGTFTTYQPGQLALNMNGSQYSIVRWTAPATGQFSITATFSGLSAIGDTSDVHVQTNGVSVFDSFVNGSPSPTNYSATLTLVLGEHVDFAVGFGSNGNDHEDTTGLDAAIVAVPEPGTLGLVGAALGSLLTLCFRKRK